MNIVGWREWVTLPTVGIPAIKAKVDTGAKTSSLHAFALETYDTDEGEYVAFKIHPLRKHKDIELTCRAPVLDRRVVKDSGGHVEERIVIQGDVKLGKFCVNTEFTLTSRDDMLFPMLLGRRAIAKAGLVVDVSESYLHGKFKIREVKRLIAEQQ